jgi:hypothetical protein
LLIPHNNQDCFEFGDNGSCDRGGGADWREVIAITSVDKTAEAAIEEEVHIEEREAPLASSLVEEKGALVDPPITPKTTLNEEMTEAVINEERLIGEKKARITLVDKTAEASIEEEVQIGEKEAPLASSLIKEKALVDPLIMPKSTVNEETMETEEKRKCHSRV